MSLNLKQMKAEVYIKLPCSKQQILYTEAIKCNEEENWYKGYIQMYQTNDRNPGKTKQYYVEDGIFKYETALPLGNGEYDHSKHIFLPATINMRKINKGFIYEAIKDSDFKIVVCIPFEINKDYTVYDIIDNRYITFGKPENPEVVVSKVNNRD